MPTIEVRYEGLFDFDALYAAIIDWSKNYGYAWHEKAYKHKVPSPLGAEQELNWQITKEVTDYIKHGVVMVAHLWDLTEVEVEVDGKKKKLSNGRIYIRIKGTLYYEWQGVFGGSKFAQTLGKWYAKLTKKELESVYADTLYYRLWNLQALIKKYFDMQTTKYAYKGYLGES